MVQGSNTGMVKWFSPDKAYGFIIPDDGGEDVFVHLNDLKTTGHTVLFEGQPVRFDTETNKKNGKPVAKNISVLR